MKEGQGLGTEGRPASGTDMFEPSALRPFPCIVAAPFFQPGDRPT